MADTPNSVPLTKESQLALPVAVIVVIAIGAYVILVMILLIIRQMLMQRGWCKETFSCCGKEGELQCCDCCVSMAESCNCCHNPSVTACLDSICPSRRRLDCADIIMCNCCENGCCNSQEPFCDCGQCDCTCNCQNECDNIDCICFKIQLKGSQSAMQNSQGATWQEGYGYGQGWGGGYPNVGGTWGPTTGAPGSGENIPWGGGPAAMTSTNLSTSNMPYGTYGPGVSGGPQRFAPTSRENATPGSWGSPAYQGSMPRTPRGTEGETNPRHLPPIPSRSQSNSGETGRGLPPPPRAAENT